MEFIMGLLRLWQLKLTLLVLQEKSGAQRVLQKKHATRNNERGGKKFVKKRGNQQDLTNVPSIHFLLHYITSPLVITHLLSFLDPLSFIRDPKRALREGKKSTS